MREKEGRKERGREGRDTTIMDVELPQVLYILKG